jgi:hypothetical protein
MNKWFHFVIFEFCFNFCKWQEVMSNRLSPIYFWTALRIDTFSASNGNLSWLDWPVEEED